MYKWGAAAAYCCARLLVARANRAVIVFALFRSVFFVPTLFSGCGRVRFFRSSIRSHHHESYKTQARAVIHFAQCASYLNTFRSIHSCTCPAHKKTSLHGKNIRRPCVSNVGCQRPHSASLHSGLSLSATLAPLADGSRLSLRQASKALHCVPLLCYLPPFGSRLLYLLCFFASPTHSPRPPTHKEYGITVVLRPIELIL